MNSNYKPAGQSQTGITVFHRTSSGFKHLNCWSQNIDTRISAVHMVSLCNKNSPPKIRNLLKTQKYRWLTCPRLCCHLLLIAHILLQVGPIIVQQHLGWVALPPGQPGTRHLLNYHGWAFLSFLLVILTGLLSHVYSISIGLQVHFTLSLLRVKEGEREQRNQERSSDAGKEGRQRLQCCSLLVLPCDSPAGGLRQQRCTPPLSRRCQPEPQRSWFMLLRDEQSQPVSRHRHLLVGDLHLCGGETHTIHQHQVVYNFSCRGSIWQ